MQKIHRRRNEQISKDFVCTYGCGKAYGSYAALYTHIKKKHADSLQIKSISLKPAAMKIKTTGRKGRPIKKQKEEPAYVEVRDENECRICQEEDCVCDSSMGNEEIERSITIMQNRVFVRFINCVGAMNVGEQFTWVRNSQEDYLDYSIEDIGKMYQEFVEHYSLSKSVKLSESWLEYLSFSSKYWDRQHITQLLKTIFAMFVHSTIQQCSLFLKNNEQFANIRRCMQFKPSEFSHLWEILKM